MYSNSKQYQLIYLSYAFLSELRFNLSRLNLQYRHMKNHCPDIGGKRGDTEKHKYGRRSSELKRGPSDVVCQTSSYLSTAGKTPTIVEGDNVGVSEQA